ncbi:MAG: serine O-acetyltransferase [Alphaproteobacteria bacterium]|nr:serine O-acetyltransferase [Alphaproteobacteria bacterium]
MAAEHNMTAAAMFKRLRDDIDSIMARDPSARSRLEVLLCFPGLHAVMFHRPAHWLWENGFRTPARFIANVSRILTGIDIHPGATIGRRLFIDHGVGTVIGETAEIGDGVTMYQDVTLGGTSPSVNARAQVNLKRHPTIRDNAIVSSGAQVLGPITVGEGAIVGANAVVLKDVPDQARVVGIPARAVGKPKAPPSEEFCPYGVTGEVVDPQARLIESLTERLHALNARVGQLEQLLAARGGAVAGRGAEAIDAVNGNGAAQQHRDAALSELK